MTAILLAAALAQDWEYHPGRGFLNAATLEQKSPEEFLAYGLSRREARDFPTALKALTLILAHVPDAAFRETALFERGHTLFRAGQFYEAYQDFKNFVLRYPQSDRAPSAKELEMRSALDLARVGEKVFLGLASSSKTGIELLRDSLKRYPREDFSSGYYQKLGKFYFDRGDWDHAAEEFNHVMEFYADSPDSVLALYMLGLTSENRFDSVERDIKPLKDARRHYERFLEEADRMRRLPGDAPRWVEDLLEHVQKRLALVYERMLEKQLRAADYYDWKGYPKSAAVFYRSVLKDDASFRRVLKAFPESKPAAKARQWLAAAGLPPAPGPEAAPPPSLPREGQPLPSPGEARSPRRIARDSAGWVLAEEGAGNDVRFVLLSAAPGAALDETPGGFRLKIGNSTFNLSGNTGMMLFDRKGGMVSLAIPEEWNGDLVQDYRDHLTRQPQATLRSWLEDRLRRHPAPALERLVRE